MDIPRRKNRQHSDKLTAELLFFCLWLTRCGEVELGCFESYGLENWGQHSPSSYRRYALHYPDYHAAYEGLDPRTLRRDKQTVRQVLLLWKDYDARRMQRDEDVEEALTAEFMARLKNL